MALLKVFLIIVEVVSSLLLIVVILLQKSKGQGLGMAFGAEMGEALFGARAGNVLVKATIWLGVIFLLNTTFLAKLYTRDQSRSLMDAARTPASVERRAGPVQPVIPMPETGPYSEPGGLVQPVAVPVGSSRPEPEPQD